MDNDNCYKPREQLRFCCPLRSKEDWLKFPVLSCNSNTFSFHILFCHLIFYCELWDYLYCHHFQSNVPPKNKYKVKSLTLQTPSNGIPMSLARLCRLFCVEVKKTSKPIENLYRSLFQPNWWPGPWGTAFITKNCWEVLISNLFSAVSLNFSIVECLKWWALRE